MRQHKKYLLE